MPTITTSGTYTFSQTVTEIATAALRLVQVVGDEEIPAASQLQTAIDAMAAMTKAWQGSGIHLWCEEEGILFLQPNQTVYYIGAGSTDQVANWYQVEFTTLTANVATSGATIHVDSAFGFVIGDQLGVQLDDGTNYWTTVSSISGTTIGLTVGVTGAAAEGANVFCYPAPLYRPLRIMGARRYQYSSRLDIPIQMWARLDYEAQPNKYTPGVTTAFFYAPQTGAGAYAAGSPLGIMNAWPTPADNTFAMRFTAQRPIQDIGTLANQADFPVEWNAALKWNLAMEIGPEFGCPTEQMTIINAAATKWFDMASRWDRESESIRFGVAMQPGYRRG